MNVDVGKVPCAPLGRGDMEFSYQGESLGDSPFAITVVPVGDEEPSQLADKRKDC